MEKGKFGISVSIIAVIAFIFAILQQPQSVLLVVGFALLAEKNEWLNKQVMQSLLLTITYYVASLVVGFIFGGISRGFATVDFYTLSNLAGGINSFIGGVLQIALIIFSVIAILNVMRGKDAGVPYFSKLMDSEFESNLSGRPQPIKPQSVKPQQVKPIYVSSVEPEPVTPKQSEIVTPPVAPLAPKLESKPVLETKVCGSCSSPLDDDASFCVECGEQV
ncbi:MAG TPA: zinc ribbon domain-containing protein [Epulopiscium sp.]|nr:zinc ribbon domain-containing protein [Candidatus Epulonipiscium sp.]